MGFLKEVDEANTRGGGLGWREGDTRERWAAQAGGTGVERKAGLRKGPWGAQS